MVVTLGSARFEFPWKIGRELKELLAVFVRRTLDERDRLFEIMNRVDERLEDDPPPTLLHSWDLYTLDAVAPTRPSYRTDIGQRFVARAISPKTVEEGVKVLLQFVIMYKMYKGQADVTHESMVQPSKDAFDIMHQRAMAAYAAAEAAPN